MHRNICSRSIASIVVPFLLMPLATSTVVAVVSSGGVGEANSMDRTIFPEETPDRIVSDREMPLDALGYLGGLFEARFYQPHSTTDDPREEIPTRSRHSSASSCAEMPLNRRGRRTLTVR